MVTPNSSISHVKTLGVCFLTPSAAAHGRQRPLLDVWCRPNSVIDRLRPPMTETGLGAFNQTQTESREWFAQRICCDSRELGVKT